MVTMKGQRKWVLIVVAALTMVCVQVQAQQSVASKIIFYNQDHTVIILVGCYLVTKVRQIIIAIVIREVCVIIG